MSPEEIEPLENRKSGFDGFLNELMPVLVDFVGKLGIHPADGVLKHAVQFVPYLSQALQTMLVTDDQDRTWLLTRMGYFVGEYFVQKYGGSWYVNDVRGSRYFGRYVVGRFVSPHGQMSMLDPFLVAQAYVDTSVPRQLERILEEVEAELNIGSRSSNPISTSP
ncbi:hypothetical protein [Ralstonia solanacearum]|uniref:hypothetical protein n=1 Tax=Ralstonia solanacearum TaxID=305 RepID=UPI0012DA3B88|nr:hypothetical protein [Ralstonia solanacearum]